MTLGKPWLMLLPLDTLTSKGRGALFRDAKMQMWLDAAPMTFTHEGKEVSVAKGMLWIGQGWPEPASFGKISWLPYEKE